MGEVININFEAEHLAIADRRAMALHDWLVAQHGPVANKAILKEMERLKRMMPSPEDRQ